GPFADVRIAERGSPAQAVSQFLEQRVPMIILADVGNTAEAKEPLARWIEDGGVLVRFAGPRLAASDDDLVPVRLRRGGRVLGGDRRPQCTRERTRGRTRSGATDPHSRWFRRVRPPAAEYAAGAGRLYRTRNRREPARVLRTAGGPIGG